MKKRIVCVLLTLIMLVSLVPVTALTASAASYTVSDDLVNFVIAFEGFSATAYKDNTQWSIGYGTKSEEGEVLPGATEAEQKAEAKRLLQAELNDVAKVVADWATARNLSLADHQIDALVSFSYNCGTGWLSANGVFRKAVLEGKTGNDFLNAISLWANVGSVPSAGLLNRRLTEANMYLNGSYSATKPANYTYVIYNANGGSIGENKMQGYDYNTSGGVAINASAVRNGHKFQGWYTEAGTYVSKLNKDTAGKTLVARWNALVTVTNDYINVREEAGADPTHSIVGKVYFGDVLELLEITETSNGQLWGRFEDGWVALQYTDYQGEAAEEEEDEDEDTDSEDKTEEKVIATGTVVNCTNLKIRQHSAAYYPQVGSLAAGTKVSIYEIEDNWGRIDKGWISLQYVALDKEIEEDDKTDSDDKDDDKDNSSSETVIATGTVNSYTNLNIRQHAGVSYPKVGSLPTGTKVEIYETTTNNGVKWGRIDEGWICMTYITLDSTSSGNVNGTPIGTGTVVNCSTAVNIRAAAGTHNALVGTAALGSTLNIYEVTTYNKVEWGRTDKGWVCMQYIQMNTGTNGGTTGGTTGGSTSTTNGGFEASNVLSNLNAIASEEVVVYDASGAKTTTTIKKGSSFTVTALGLFSKGKNIDAETVMAQCSLGYVEAEKLVMTAPSATYYSAVEMQYDTDGAEKYIQIGEALTITEVEVRGEDTIAYAEEHDVGVYAEYLLTSRTNDMYTVTSDATVYMYDEDGKELITTTMVAYRDSNLYISGFKTIDGVSYGYIEDGIEVRADVYEDAYIEASKLKSLVTGATGGTGSTGSTGGNTSTGGSTSGSTDTGVQTGVIANADSVNVRSSAGVSYTNKVGSVTRGTKVTIYETTTVNGALWGRIGENRWVAMQYVVLDTTSGGSNTGTGTNTGIGTGTGTGTSDVATGIVKTNNLNVRSGPGLGYGKVGTLSLGSTVNVYEQQLNGGMIWGRIGTNRWVCLSYVTLTSTGTSESTGTGVMGTIARCFYAVNVRSAPGTGNALIGQILVGSRVEIFEQKLYGTQYWGRVAQGWICMDYVLLDSELPGGTVDTNTGNTGNTGNTNTNTGTSGSINTGTVAPVSTVATGKVAASSAFVSVYKDAAKSEIVDTVEDKASVSISELKANSDTVMGKISAGWIDMANVDMTAYANASKEIDIYSAAGGAESGTTMAAGESVEIVAVTAVGADVWCQTKFGGFVKMSDITLSTSASCNTSTNTNTSTGTGTATGTNTNVSTNTGTTVTTGAQTYTGTVIGTNSLKVRGTPSMNGTVGTTLKLGTPVMIYETAIADYLAWGRCDAGWICLVYVDLVPYSSGALDARVVQTDGTVIYSEAGGGETVGTYPKCTVVDIYEISGNWGRTADGWVSFNDLLA